MFLEMKRMGGNIDLQTTRAPHTKRSHAISILSVLSTDVKATSTDKRMSIFIG